MPNKKKLDFDVKRYLVAEVLYPGHMVPLHVGECHHDAATKQESNISANTGRLALDSLTFDFCS